MDRTVYDVDNTLTINDKNKNYSEKELNPLFMVSNLESFIRQEKAFYTARNMLTYNEDLELINKNTRPIAETWLNQNLFHGSLYVGKPFCGERGVYVDDRAVNINSHYKALKSGLFHKHIDLVVCFHNADKILNELLRELVELSAILPMLSFILVNNDSNDDTGKILSSVSAAYPFMSYVEVENSHGYGSGVKAGMRAVRKSAEFVGFAHGNLKFSISGFFDYLLDVHDTTNKAYFTTRVGRDLKESILSYSLRLLASIRYVYFCPDCIGAVRLVDRQVLSCIDIGQGPNNYTFDLWFFKNVSKLGQSICSLKLIERKFLGHYSSWSRGPVSTGKMIFSYIKTIFFGS